MNLKKITCLTDFSPIAENAFKFAAELAQREGASVKLVHVYKKPYFTQPRSGGFVPALDAEADRQLREYINEELHKLAALDCAKGLTLSRELMAEKGITEVAQSFSPANEDLVVMGTRGESSGLFSALVGSHAERVIRHSEVPVLTVPEHSHVHGMKHVLFATDFGDAVEQIYPEVVAFAISLKAHLHVGVISSGEQLAEQNKVEAAFAALQEKHPYKDTSLHIHSALDVTMGLVELAEELKIDLLAMRTHGRTGLRRLFNMSIAEELSQRLTVPMLSFNRN